MKKIGLFLLLPLLAGAAEHVPWKLKGAQERIEEYRKGGCELKLELPDGSAVPAGTRIELEQTRHAFDFGGSLAQVHSLYRHESYAAYKEHFARLFNYATIGFYWAQHERKPGAWKLQSYTSDIMDWAVGQGMTLRGHPLMWHNTAPRWIASTTRDVKEIDRDVREHVRMLVKTYPQIDQWDLHNETPGIRLQEPRHGVRRWVELYGGPGPVTQRLVEEVRAIRPSGFFAMNHFTYKDPQYHEQIRYCVENKVKFDAIGIQSHMHTKGELWAEKQMWDTLDEYAKYGKPIQLTEVSILSCEPLASWRELKPWEETIKAAMRARRPLPFKESNPEGEQCQAEYARDFYTLAFSHLSVNAIIWWSVSDKDAWRGMPAGLLDAYGNPKPAYKVLDKLINETWRTKKSIAVDRNSRVRLRGFYGSYEVRMKHQGQMLMGTFDLERDQIGVVSAALK
ncbi:MAG: endo-1,4-beta-xylanase [Kiritimatiellales bacterium]|nr:endo-1,4-beta-xylanase [Kiritimatiellales bacterium]